MTLACTPFVLDFSFARRSFVVPYKLPDASNNNVLLPFQRCEQILRKEWKASNPTISDVVERIIATLRSEVRWAKSVQRLRDEGKLEHSPRDIGMLLKEVQADIRAEELDFISKKLVEFALPRVLRASTAGLPEWYKRQVLESAFTDPR